jgi:hypothetical protein
MADRWTSRPAIFVKWRFELNNRAPYALKQHGDFGCDANELLVPELVLQIAEQFNEGDQSTPGMRTMYDEAFQKNASHHFTETIVLHFHKEVEEQRAEPVGMGVGISQMKNHGAQEVVLSYVSRQFMSLVDSLNLPSTSKLAARYCRATTPGSLATNTEEPLLALA